MQRRRHRHHSAAPCMFAFASLLHTDHSDRIAITVGDGMRKYLQTAQGISETRNLQNKILFFKRFIFEIL